MSYSPEYRAWKGMKERCQNPTNKSYHNYGGRNISVCERWLISFETFFDDMGYRPSAKHSIDRINVDGNYEPKNCRWALSKEQGRNRRDTRFLTFRGQTRALTEWAEILGISRWTLWDRVVRRGWTTEQALSLAPGDVTKWSNKDALIAEQTTEPGDG